MDNGPDIPIIAKALRGFTKAALRLIATVPDVTPEEAQYSIWRVKSYPQTPKALMRSLVFAGNETKADACICGYDRGLQMAAFKFKTTPPTLKRKLKPSVK
jgi:hypothetical protein